MSKKDKNNSCPFSDRLGKVGGQAVLEGVMMKAGNRMVTTCRKSDGSLIVTDDSFTSAKDKNSLFGLPLVRGVVSFVESLTMSFKTLGASAEALGLEEEEEEPSKFERWLSEKMHIKLTDAVMVVSLLLGLALSALLFVFLPIWITAGINFLLGLAFKVSMPAVVSAILEGLIKVGIFVGYLAATSMMKEIRRTFMYHGAEHKSIACFEAGEELTPENAKRHTRFHPRCGTSFMFFMILLGIFAGLIIKTLLPGLHTIVYTLIRLLILPILMGLGYEFIRFAGKHPSWFTRMLSAPGLWMQRITTKEPTEDMLEVAITSLKCALRDDYPEFREFYEAKPWLPKEEVESGEVQSGEVQSAVSSENQSMTDFDVANAQKQEAIGAERTEASSAPMFQELVQNEEAQSLEEEIQGEPAEVTENNDL
ncbi:MAG: DUF1385 domain-containing protein [Clostridia bacterium]|nr:DUF1385 domain-containing protein [Clostridia bacterium]